MTLTQPLAVSDLYPPAQPAGIERVLRETLTTARDENRTPLLRRALTDGERAELKERFGVLAKYADPGKPKEKEYAIAGLLAGFGGAAVDVNDARVIVSQYEHTCRDLPLWAVTRACQRFASGSVKPEEVGQKNPLDLNFRPTTAQLYVVAAAIAKPVMEERYRISTAMRGVLMIAKRELTDEERAAGAAKMREAIANMHASRAEREAAEQAAGTGRAALLAQEARQQSAVFIEREYRAAGLDVPPWKGDMPPAALSLMLSLGWRIGEDPHGKKILVGPPKPPPPEHRRAPAKADAMNDEIPF